MSPKFTTEQQHLYNINRIKAWKFFYPEGNGKAKPGFHLHHKDPSWRVTDIDRYVQWNPDDLMMVTASDHGKIHSAIAYASPDNAFTTKGSHLSDEQKAKMSAKLKGRKFTEEHKQKIGLKHKGKKLSEEQKRMIGESKRRKPLYTRYAFHKV